MKVESLQRKAELVQILAKPLTVLHLLAVGVRALVILPSLQQRQPGGFLSCYRFLLVKLQNQIVLLKKEKTMVKKNSSRWSNCEGEK